MKKKILIVCGLLLVLAAVYAGSLSDWGRWSSLNSNFDSRVRCVRLNTSNGYYVWEIEVKNISNSSKSLSVRTDQTDWRRNTISAGQTYVFPIIFSTSEPGDSLDFYYKE